MCIVYYLPSRVYCSFNRTFKSSLNRARQPRETQRFFASSLTLYCRLSRLIDKVSVCQVSGLRLNLGSVPSVANLMNQGRRFHLVVSPRLEPQNSITTQCYFVSKIPPPLSLSPISQHSKFTKSSALSTGASPASSTISKHTYGSRMNAQGISHSRRRGPLLH